MSHRLVELDMKSSQQHTTAFIAVTYSAYNAQNAHEDLRVTASLGQVSGTILSTQSPHSGIHSMPHELLLKIPQYLGPITGQFQDNVTRIWPYPANNERRTALRALSQTSRFLRLFYLPLAWEYLDTYTRRLGGSISVHLTKPRIKEQRARGW
jgi:hypothetical protein